MSIWGALESFKGARDARKLANAALEAVYGVGQYPQLVFHL